MSISFCKIYFNLWKVKNIEISEIRGIFGIDLKLARKKNVDQPRFKLYDAESPVTLTNVTKTTPWGP